MAKTGKYFAKEVRLYIYIYKYIYNICISCWKLISLQFKIVTATKATSWSKMMRLDRSKQTVSMQIGLMWVRQWNNV